MINKKLNNKSKKLLFKAGADWNFELIEKITEEIHDIAINDLKLDIYPNQIEIVSAEQMIDAYASIGLPINYNHWSFGKEFLKNFDAYTSGKMGLAYEMVINSSPCIAYLMEENSMTMQTLVIAHACYGHNAVFKNNYLFKENTDAEGIIDYLSFAKNYVKKCEEKYGEEEVESILDSCHALGSYGIDKYKRPQKLSPKQEEKKALERFEQELNDYNPLWEKTIPKKKNVLAKEEQNFPTEPQENILYFIEKNAPTLANWKRELIRITRKINEYISGQMITKTLNEGFATFTHYYIMTELEKRGVIDDGSYLEFLISHNSVIRQLDYDHDFFSGFNPYAIGFGIFMDIKRICENPTEEDKRWFPNIAGGDWRKEIQYAMRNFNDETLIAQYLSPKVIRDFKLFRVTDDSSKKYIEVTAIHDDDGYQDIRTCFAKSYRKENYLPDIQITDVDVYGTRKLKLLHTPYMNRPLEKKSSDDMILHIQNLWEFPVKIYTIERNSENVPWMREISSYSGKFGKNLIPDLITDDYEINILSK